MGSWRKGLTLGSVLLPSGHPYLALVRFLTAHPPTFEGPECTKLPTHPPTHDRNPRFRNATKDIRPNYSMKEQPMKSTIKKADCFDSFHPIVPTVEYRTVP